MTITKVLTPVAFVALMALAAVPASAGQRRSENGHGGSRSHGSARGYSGSGYRGGGHSVGRGPSYYRPYYYRPYYSFRPRVSLGFGLSMGYPVYSYPYADPYAYGAAAPAPSYAYPAQPYASPNQYAPPSQYGSSGQGYPAPQPAPSVGVQRGREESESGGISLEVTPGNAAVLVDGTYVGTAGEFGPSSQPLGLNAGRHHVEVRASGYRTMTFEADVRPGEVIPYRGTLQRN